MNTPNKQITSEIMLDTLGLKLRYPAFRVTNPTLFAPAFIIRDKFSGSEYQFGRNRFSKYQQNPTKLDKAMGIYKPRLTGYVRFEGDKPIYDLHVEFSVPKLLFGQNLQELENDDFERVVGILQERLLAMGIETSGDELRQAVVVKAHFGKNILIPTPHTVQEAIEQLYKADIGKTKDVNIRHYQNGGQSLYLYASSSHVIFYDKLRDIIASKNKGVEKDKLKIERALLASIEKGKEQEILRFEVRFAKQQALNSFLSKIVKEKVKEINFKKIFDKELCKKVLLVMWKKITNVPMSQIALKMEKPIGEVFDVMVKNLTSESKKRAHSLNTALMSVGLYALIKHDGVRRVRNRIEKNWTNKSWVRLSKKARMSAKILKEFPVSHAVDDIQSALEKFEKYNCPPPDGDNKTTDKRDKVDSGAIQRQPEGSSGRGAS